MTEKVKVTAEQAEAFDRITKKYSIERIIRDWIKSEYDKFLPHNECLRELSLEEFMRILYIGYEVEKEYAVGEWVVFRNISGQTVTAKVIAVQYGNERIQFDSISGWQPIAYVVRHATPEEIKAEKERRVWAGIGRKVGQFMYGDVGVSHSESIWTELSSLKTLRDSDDLKGFYPAESFISFEEDDSNA